jgi:hypothetical protein
MPTDNLTNALAAAVIASDARKNDRRIHSEQCDAVLTAARAERGPENCAEENATAYAAGIAYAAERALFADIIEVYARAQVLLYPV